MKLHGARHFESLGPRYLLSRISLVSQPASSDAAMVLAARDMDADGDQDIIVVKDDALAWLENQSENGAVKFEEHPVSNVTSRLFDLADLDGDQDLELIIREPVNGISVLENTDDGFVLRQIIESPSELSAPPKQPQRVVLGALNALEPTCVVKPDADPKPSQDAENRLPQAASRRNSARTGTLPLTLETHACTLTM